MKFIKLQQQQHNFIKMADRKYQTIDPLILETLNLNEKRIHHIFDILHGRDSLTPRERITTHASYSAHPVNKLPRILEQYEQAKSPRQPQAYTQPVKKQRGSFTSLARNAKSNKSTIENMEDNLKQSKLGVIRERKSKSLKQKTIATIPAQEQPRQEPITDRRDRLIHDYGMSQIRRNKSLQINPKDVYRLQIQSIISKPTEIEELDDSQKLMKRLKKRYQHLRKFDGNYYSKLCKNQLILL